MPYFLLSSKNAEYENKYQIAGNANDQVEFFYSHRRSCINKEQDYGRCISVILMT